MTLKLEKCPHSKELILSLEKLGEESGEGFTFSVIRLLWEWYDLPSSPIKDIYWDVMEELIDVEPWIKSEAQALSRLYGDDIEEASREIAFYVLQIELLRRGLMIEKDKIKTYESRLGKDRDLFVGILRDFQSVLKGESSSYQWRALAERLRWM
ncbi:MAG: hypothetical protein ACP5PC_03075 [bacterium]